MSIMSELANNGRVTRLDQQQFSATVIDNNDPRRQQRVKARIADVHRGIPDDHIPWATKADTGVSSAGGVGTVDIPPIGAKVSIRFLDNSGYSPQYSGPISTDDVGVENVLPNYPNSYGRTDHGGNSIYTDTSTNNMVVAHASGTVITILGSGEISITSASKINVHSTGDLDLRAGGNLFVQANGTLHLRGSNIKTNKKLPGDPGLPTDSGSPQAPSTTTPIPRPVIPNTPNDIDR